MTSFKRPVESSEPRRKTPTQAESRTEWGDLATMSEAGSRREVTTLPVAYAVPAPVAEMQGFPQPSAPSPLQSGSYASHSSSDREAESRTVYDESALGTQVSSPGEYSLYSRGFSTYEESDRGGGGMAGNGGGGEGRGEEEGEGGGGDRFAGSREWAQQQESSKSWISRTETAEDPWAGSGRQDDDDDGYGGATGRGRRGLAAVAGGGDPNAPMHDLPPYPPGQMLLQQQQQQQASQRSIMSHDLTGFSDFDPKSSKFGSGDDGDLDGGGISAPHAAASANHYGNTGGAGRAGLIGAAAAAEAADANNKAAKSAKLERKRARQQQMEAEEEALRAQGLKPPLQEGTGRHGRSGGGGKTGRDRGETKEETEGGSGSGMSEFRISTMESANAFGDPYDERRRAEEGGGEGGGEYALPTYHGLFFTPLMFLLCAVLLCWEFSLSNWEAVSLGENPSYGPSVETLIEAGAKRTDLILDGGDWWRLWTPMFLHAGVVHFLANMIGFVQVGAMVERVFGWWRVGVIYLIAGVFGTIASAIFVPTQVMVGASGAIFGVFGALWADLWQNWSVNQDKCRMLTVLTILTVLQIVLGLMPFLDNFAHIGGLVMGFFIGLGLLVQKREDGSGEALDKKCYQTTLQLVSAIAVPTLMILGFSLLYGRSDPSEWCGWCENISCVEFPPGDNPWWACDECSTQGFSANKFDNGTISILCPDSVLRFSNECSAESDDLLIDCCIGLCL